MALRDRGIRPVTCNTYIGAMNAFCLWLHEEEHAPARVKQPKLRVERRLVTLRDDAQLGALIGFKPKTFQQARRDRDVPPRSRSGGAKVPMSRRRAAASTRHHTLSAMFGYMRRPLSG